MKNRALSDKEVKDLLKTVRRYKDVAAQRDAEWIRLLLNTGIRVECLTLLSVDDAIKAINTKYLTLRAETTKGSKEHTLYCNTEARTAFVNLLALRKVIGFDPWDCNGLLIISRNRRGISVRSIQSRLKIWATAAGIERKVSPHDLRHTFGTRIILRSPHSAGARRLAQLALNHANINTTTIYEHPTENDMINTMEAVGK